MQAMTGTSTYYVYERVLGDATSKSESMLTGVSFEQARSYIIEHELPLRKAHLARMTKWSAIHKKRLVFTPQSESCSSRANAACGRCMRSCLSLELALLLPPSRRDP